MGRLVRGICRYFHVEAGFVALTVSREFQMPSRRKQSDTNANPPEGWRDTLQAIPTAFGRLVYLRSLSDCSDLPIGHTAFQVFSYWLRLGLSEQVRDLRAYLADNGGNPPSNFARLIPPAARDVERQLFLTDMETLVGLLRVEGDATYTVL
jgi:hypothetical protein